MRPPREPESGSESPEENAHADDPGAREDSNASDGDPNGLENPSSLTEVVEQLEEGQEEGRTDDSDSDDGGGDSNGDTVPVRALHETLGTDSFGPILVVAGLLCLTPIGVVPGVPTGLAVVVLLLSVQFVAGRERIWLPDFILDRHLDAERLEKSLRILKRIAGPVDRLFTPRLSFMVEGRGTRFVGGFTAGMALFIPPLEFVPFTVTIPAVTIAAIGLGLLTRDGLVVLGALIFAGLGFLIVGGALF